MMGLTQYPCADPPHW